MSYYIIMNQRASGYILRNDSVFNSGFVDLRFEGPAGGHYSTVNDELLALSFVLELKTFIRGPTTKWFIKK